MIDELTNAESSSVIDFKPSLKGTQELFLQFCVAVSQRLAANGTSRQAIIEQLRAEYLSIESPVPNDSVDLYFVESILLDMLALGWNLDVLESGVKLTLPRKPVNMINATEEEIQKSENDFNHATKAQVQLAHLVGRDAQLREPSVSDFIKGMERRRLDKTGWHSIYSLMRDGRELSQKLRDVNQNGPEEERLEALSRIISPYIQFVEGNKTCAHTGLRLCDVWRYFRHTWTNEYKPLPGRSLMILVRDAAAPNHPVIGIAALGSSMVQLGSRDKWIGWEQDAFIAFLMSNPSLKTAKWIVASLNNLISGIYVDDLIGDGLLTPKGVRMPTEDLITGLRQEAEEAIKRHRKDPQKDIHNKQKSPPVADSDWVQLATTHLYRSKRCENLARLLSIKLTFDESGLSSLSKNCLKNALDLVKVQSALSQLVRMIKAEHVGIGMMDITVCGAIAPYNALLGGKLVCMLLASPEVTQHYARRYGNQASLIASGIKGQAVVRKPTLVLLCTTSLYGVGSSQYNRIKIPAGEVGGENGERIAYLNIGHTHGYGTYHFSKMTINLGGILTARREDGVKVNSIMGEGVNPLLRKIRDAMDYVGLPSDAMLWHGNRRETYVVPLAKNFREILLGRESKPAYFIPQSNTYQGSELIASYWRKRWLSRRITNPEVLDKVESHTLIYPITHGAQVPRPVDANETGGLYAQWQEI